MNPVRLSEVGGAKSGGVAKQKSVGNVGKLTQVRPLHRAPLPLANGRSQWHTWLTSCQLAVIHLAYAEDGQSHSEADRKGHGFPSTTLAFQDSQRLSTKGKVSWGNIKGHM